MLDEIAFIEKQQHTTSKQIDRNAWLQKVVIQVKKELTKMQREDGEVS